MHVPKDPAFTGLLLAFSATALFSTKSILIKWAYLYGVDTTSLLTWRMLISAPIYLGILWLVCKQTHFVNPQRHAYLAIIGLGVIGYYCASWLDLYALNYISAHYERLVLYTYPAFVLLLNSLLNKQWISKGEMLALALAYAGLVLIFNHDLQLLGQDILKGTLMVLLSAFCYSLYIIGSQKYSKQIGSKFFTCVGMLAASAAISVHFFITHQISDLAQPWQVIAIAAGMAIFATVIPSFLMNAAIARVGGNKASIMGSVGPVLTTLFAISFLDEVFTLWHLVGMLLVLSGMYWLNKAKPQPKKLEKSATKNSAIETKATG